MHSVPTLAMSGIKSKNAELRHKVSEVDALLTHQHQSWDVEERG